MPKRKRAIDKPPVKLLDYQLVNHEKLDRVINGFIGREGKLEGGLGKDASDIDVLVAYDKLAGLILDKSGNKVATGSFYDFEKGCAREEFKPKPAKPKAEGGLRIKRVGDKEPKKVTKKK